ncbi:hypothetical protein EDB92DRAFT_1881153, partial [Lactarius akahatsu]
MTSVGSRSHSPDFPTVMGLVQDKRRSTNRSGLWVKHARTRDEADKQSNISYSRAKVVTAEDSIVVVVASVCDVVAVADSSTVGVPSSDRVPKRGVDDALPDMSTSSTILLGVCMVWGGMTSAPSQEGLSVTVTSEVFAETLRVTLAVCSSSNQSSSFSMSSSGSESNRLPRL